MKMFVPSRDDALRYHRQKIVIKLKQLPAIAVPNQEGQFRTIDFGWVAPWTYSPKEVGHFQSIVASYIPRRTILGSETGTD